MKKKKIVHPYIPNSVPEVQAEMLREIGVKDVNELYDDIPEDLRFNKDLNLPDPFVSEYALKNHIQNILSKNTSCEENISFLGAGCYNHYVPAICDEIIGRSEFLTAYAGEPYEDHGRFQALFEYESLMAELLDLDVVNVPTYDWGQAVSTSIRMASRITQREEVLLAGTISPDRAKVIWNYCHPVMSVKTVGFDLKTGLLDIEDLQAKLSNKTACIYFENPSYLGFIESQGGTISELAHQNGALCVVGVDPISLGILTPPSQYGADIACGDIQGLGNHMSYGGALAGFIATRDEEKFVQEYPSRLFGITKTSVEGEWGFSDVYYDRTSFAYREEGKEFIGTAAALYGISTAVYLSLMGPNGMRELAENILRKSAYLKKRLSRIPGVSIRLDSASFKEFVVDFSASSKSVEQINQALLKEGIFGGKDITEEFEEFSNCALYCITETHTKENLDQLTSALEKILK